MHWLQFRGPNASGIAPENAVPPIHFSVDTNLLWKTEILPGWSSPCIVNDKVYLTGYKKEDNMLVTFALDRRDGSVFWVDSVKVDSLKDIHSVTSHTNLSVTSNGKMVYAAFPDFGIIAYDLNGIRAWEFTHPPTAGYFGGSCSPVFYNNTIVLIINDDKDNRIVGLDSESGELLWNLRPSGENWDFINMWSTPVFWKDLMILHLGMHLVAYDMNSLEKIWWIELPTNGVGTPVIEGDKLYANVYIQIGEKRVRGMRYSFDEMLDFYDLNRNQKLEQGEIPDSIMFFKRPEIPSADRSSIKMNDERLFNGFDTNSDQAYDSAEWTSIVEYIKPYLRDHGMIALPLDRLGELSDSALCWMVTDHTPETPSPLVSSESVFFIKNGGIITVVNKETGEVKIQERLGAPGAYIASPMLADNRIYSCSFNGTVIVFSADDFSILAQNKLKEKIGASPVAVDDVLYIRTDKHMYAFRNEK